VVLKMFYGLHAFIQITKYREIEKKIINLFFQALLNTKQDLDQMFRRLSNCSMQYEQRLGEASGWLSDLERAISHATLGASEDIGMKIYIFLKMGEN
jgi:uncharacterized protein YdiU (UPF0061 family)